MSEQVEGSQSAEQLDDIFAPQGPLAGVLHGYAPRAPQLEMARAVARALAHADTLVVEAGTGVGKTMAYLIPALLCGHRVVISTGTKNLQDQLFHRDLPNVTAALGQPVKTALLKGRSNYLCRYRLEQARSLALPPKVDIAVTRVAGWALDTKHGDIAEYTAMPEDHPVWPHVTSTADNCLGQECPQYGDCHVVKARRRAQAADLVIVNHHLLLADFTLKEEGFGELLPGAEACIIDEAHQLPDIASRFFGVRLSARQIKGLIGDLETEAADAQVDVESVREVVGPLRDAQAAFRETLGRWDRRVNFSQLPEASLTALEALGKSLDAVHELLDDLNGHTAGLDALGRRAVMAVNAVERLCDAERGDDIRWVEVFRGGFALHSTPLEAADQLRDIMQRQDCAWVMTSATLAVQEKFDHFVERMGLVEPTTLQLGSPFDFAENALLYLPPDMPAPSSQEYTKSVLRCALPLVSAAGGGAFILFTSRRALNEAANLLREYKKYPVLAQGDAPRDELLRQFREHGNAVLLGTSSFWEGVDVRGQALSLVVIDKLPFASPGDPVIEARLHALKQRGVNAFMQHQLPEAVLALKQGVGRLIRDPDDTGVCVLCDPRITQKSYGRVFRASLPPMRVTTDAAEASSFLSRDRT
ncbi:MAG: ATP-dependent DNA helicase [Gammaproteobacteria bacterium]